MTKYTTRRQTVMFLGATGAALAATSSHGQTTPSKARRAGAANYVTGDVIVTDANGKQALASGAVIREGQTIETGANAEAHVVLDDGGFLAIRPSSRIQIDKIKMNGTFDDSLSMRLFSGALRSITGWVGKFDKRNYQLAVGTATIGIRGTDHQVAFIAEGDERNGEIAGVHNWVTEGSTTLRNSGGEINIDPGHAAWAPHSGQAPMPHDGIPNYLQARRTKHEARIEGHAKRIREHIEMRMRKRGMLKDGENLEDAQRRHQAMRSEQEKQHPNHGSSEHPAQRAHQEVERKMRHPKK